MTLAATLASTVRDRTLAVTAVLTVLGYALVAGTFMGLLPIYPDLSAPMVDLLTHLIAVINSLTLVAIIAGVYYIKHRNIPRHRAAMLTAFTLIMLFLVVYLLRVGGGFEKAIVAPPLATQVYLVMLAIHILLSILAMPVVLYAVLLGLTHTPTELADTPHARVGRIAAGAWILSLFLGIVTYVLLNHVYASEPRAPRGALLLLAATVGYSPRELVAMLRARTGL